MWCLEKGNKQCKVFPQQYRLPAKKGFLWTLCSYNREHHLMSSKDAGIGSKTISGVIQQYENQ